MTSSGWWIYDDMRLVEIRLAILSELKKTWNEKYENDLWKLRQNSEANIIVLESACRVAVMSNWGLLLFLVFCSRAAVNLGNLMIWSSPGLLPNFL